MRTHETDTKLGTFCKKPPTKLACTCQNISHKRQRKAERFFQIKKNEMWHLSVVPSCGLDAKLENNIHQGHY